MIFDIGRMVVKLAGRDSGKRAVIVDVLEGNNVLIDGETRRRSCNILHIEPLDEKVAIDKGASHETVVALFKERGVIIREKKSREKTVRTMKQKKQKVKPVEKPKAVKKKAVKKKAVEKEVPAEEKKEE